MKKTSLFLPMAGFLLTAGLFYSCTKDPTLTDAEELSLKSAPITVALTPIEQLGKFLYYDKISSPNSMACADCHKPSVGFTGATPGINIHGSVYRGADAQNFGDRKPPSAAYATYAEILHRESDGTFEGGMFWDGRATGERLKSPAAEQALGPFLNPAEHNLQSKKEVLEKIAKSNYISMWKEVFPNDFSLNDANVDLIYDQVGLAIAAYEGSGEVNQFSSKFDYVMKGMAEFTEQEALGLELFEGKGQCAECHTTTFDDDVDLVLFTDYTYDNLGVPKNPKNPVYKYNPNFVDLGLGGFLATVEKWKMYAQENYGKQKVPTLRNVDKRPGLGFTKAYTHNGYFKSLKEVVHFYNTRDEEDSPWPPAEFPGTVNKDELGKLGLTDAEEDAIVAFMGTLSDGYQVKLKK